MENSVCIDTDIFIDHLRGKNPGADIYAKIITEEIPYTTSITRFELFCGARNQKEEDIINECLLGFSLLPFDKKSSQEAARIYRDLKKKGQLIGMRDILIAGIALANNLPVATKNKKEFERIKNLNIWE